MSLDKNLFTLSFTPHQDNPNVIDLVDPSGTVHYRKQRVTGTTEYKIELYDPTTESLLATAYAPTAASKVKTIELCNPTCSVELKHTGSYTFKWSFKWEEHELEWKREECFILRKPDPPVIVSVTKETSGRLKPTTVQILDYNLNRFDIDDRKGLEIVILTALLTFSDNNEAAAHLAEPALPNKLVSRVASVAPLTKDLPPPTPPKPAPRTGVERIVEMQTMKGEYNEIIISDEGSVADYAQYCNRLLQDDAMLFVSLKSAEAEQVPKVLQVVEETKRIRYKAGLDEEEGLHQYVLYDQKDQKKGPRIINLDDERANKYAPPTNLTVHLSKISMPELQPKAVGNDKQSNKHSVNKKEEKKASSSSAAQQRPNPRPAPATPSNSSPTSNKPAQGQKLQRPPPKQAFPPPSKYPLDPKQQITITPPAQPPGQYPNPSIYNPRPHKKSPSAPDNSYPRPSSSSGRPTEQNFYAPPVGHSGPNQYLRPTSPMPGAWPGASPSPTPPPPGTVTPGVQHENGDHKHQNPGSTIAHGASSMVHGFLGLISAGKTK